jgi:tetratricopeptide (TPR) repeat protein
MSIRHALTAVALLLFSIPASAQFASKIDRQEAIQHYRTGQEYMEDEQFEKAAASFQQAIEKDRFLTLAHYSLGQAYMALKQFPKAIEAFTNCRETFRTLHALTEKDRVAVERQRDEEIRELKESESKIRGGQMKFSELKADQIEARINELERQRSSLGGPFMPPSEVSLALGSAYFRSGALEEAEREYRAAINVNPKMGEAHNNLAVVLFMTQRLDDAKAEVKLAKRSGYKVNPQFEEDLKKASPGSN